jgi:hypothetical protein
MKSFVLAAVVLAFTAGAALAAGIPVTAAQKAEFSKLCLKNSGGNQTLCTCKTKMVGKLIDSDFMQVVLDSMAGKTTPVNDTMKYAVYISKSNAICAPGM